MQLGVPRFRTMPSCRTKVLGLLLTAGSAVVLLSSGPGFLAAPTPTMRLCADASLKTVERGSLTARHSMGPAPVYGSGSLRKPHGWKRQLMKRMPHSTYTTEQIMQRVTTILIHNIEEKWRDAPMKTVDLMKEIGLRGRQIKEKKYINAALDLLSAQKVIYKVKQNPIRWEIHEEYRRDGVPRISRDKRDPWKLSHTLKFERTKVPKYGPAHGIYRDTPESARPRKSPPVGPFPDLSELQLQ